MGQHAGACLSADAFLSYVGGTGWAPWRWTAPLSRVSSGMEIIQSKWAAHPSWCVGLSPGAASLSVRVCKRYSADRERRQFGFAPSSRARFWMLLSVICYSVFMGAMLL